MTSEQSRALFLRAVAFDRHVALLGAAISWLGWALTGRLCWTHWRQAFWSWMVVAMAFQHQRIANSDVPSEICLPALKYLRQWREIYEERAQDDGRPCEDRRKTPHDERPVEGRLP